MTPTRLAGLVFAAAVALSGCAGCRPDKGQTSARGEIGVVYEVDGTKLTSREAVYDFGSVFMGQRAPLKLVVKNLGRGPLTLDKLEKD